MENPEVTLRLAAPTLAALRRIATAEDVTVGQLVRDAIARDLDRRRSAKTPVRADEQLVASLRALLAQDFADARSWHDLATRLSHKGYRLVEAGGGLVLQDWNGERQCKGSELGYPYAQLARRFCAPFPGHSHGMPPAAHRIAHAAPRA